MKKSPLSKVPEFQNDHEIAAFMEEYDGFELVDAGLAEIVPTPHFVRQRNGRKTLRIRRRRCHLQPLNSLFHHPHQHLIRHPTFG